MACFLFPCLCGLVVYFRVVVCCPPFVRACTCFSRILGTRVCGQPVSEGLLLVLSGGGVENTEEPCFVVAQMRSKARKDDVPGCVGAPVQIIYGGTGFYVVN